MKKNVRTYILMLVICALFTGTYGQKANRQSASDAFAGGKYEQAYEQFSELLVRYPKDPLYKYYSAACLVNLEKEPEKAAGLLRSALSSGSVKSMPDDVLFYYGRALQFQGNYDEAEKAFARFTADAGRRRAKELNVPDYIQQCRDNQGRLIENVAMVTKEPLATPPAVYPEVPAKPSARQPLPAEVNSSLEDSLEKQYTTDSIRATAKPVTAVQSNPVTVIEQEMKPTENEPVPPTPKPLSEVPSVPVVEKPAEKSTEIRDTTIKLREKLSKPVGVFSSFEILAEPVIDPKATIEINPEPLDGMVYRIQTAVFRNPVSLSYFKGISPIYGFRSAGANVTTYYAGIFRQAADAAKALASVRAKGFKDAFVVAQSGNKVISAERAAILEKEWGTKPLFNVEANSQQQLDTIPPTLVLKVEVLRSLQPLKPESIEPVRKLAGKRNFDILNVENGSSAYLIGNFITFESAEEFANLLQRNGYREAKVVAWLGRREIDIQTARQLFETLR